MFGVKYVGDLSKADASLLAYYGWKSESILEFGAGASTQIFAQCNPKRFVSVETDDSWIDRTRQNLETLGIADRVTFNNYENVPNGTYDLIFVDGVWEKRQNFALQTWTMLSDDGVMIFHDTRRWYDAANVGVILKTYHEQIAQILVNHAVDDEIGPSNCTVIRKRPTLVYEDWNQAEGKEPWMYGHAEPLDVSLWPTV